MSQAARNHDVSSQDFHERVIDHSGQTPVLVDFWAPWCGPCRILAPVLTKLADAYKGSLALVKINTDREPRLAQEYAVRALPTVKMFKDGRVVDEFAGVLPESAIKAFIDRHIERTADKLRRQAETLHEAGDPEGALGLLKAAAELEPDNSSVLIATAGVLMHRGDIDQAQTMLEDLPVNAGLDPAVKKLQAQLGFARAAQNADPVALKRFIESKPDDLEARYRLGACKVMRGEYEEALEQFFQIMRRDRGFEHDAGRKGMLAVFELLGGSGELVSRYRAKMVNVLH